MYDKPEERALRRVGSHSGMERAIFDDQGASASTHLHEMIHDRIFYETADGLFHLLVQRLAADAEIPAMRPINKALSKYLFAETRAAHEAIATYMGIVYLETYHEDEKFEENNSALKERARLPLDYAGYYAVLGDLLDPHARAPWLRLAIAWPIAIGPSPRPGFPRRQA